MIAKIKFLPQPQNTKSNTFMDQTKVNTFGLNAICNRDRSKPFVFLFSTRGSNKTHFPKMSVLFAFWDPQFYLTTFFSFSFIIVKQWSGSDWKNCGWEKINLTGFKPRSISNSNRNFKWIQFLNYYNKIETASLVNLIHSLHIFLVFIGHATRAHIWNISQYISHNDVLISHDKCNSLCKHATHYIQN